MQACPRNDATWTAHDRRARVSSGRLRAGTGIACLALLLTQLANPHGSARAADSPLSNAAEKEVWRLRQDGRYEQALARARILLRMSREDPACPGYRLREAQAEVRSLERITALPLPARAELARADRLETEFRDARRAQRAGVDSLAALQLDIRLRILGPEDQETAAAMVNRARAEEDSLHSASDLLMRALPVQVRAFGGESPVVVATLGEQALLFGIANRYEQADSVWQKALAIYRRIRCAEDSTCAEVLATYAFHREVMGDRIMGEALLREAVRNARKYRGIESADTQRYMGLLAVLLLDEADYEEAAGLYRGVLAVQPKDTEGNSRSLLLLRHLGAIHERRAAFDSAEVYLRAAMDLAKKTYRADDPALADPCLWLGSLLAVRGSFGEAESLLAVAIRGRKRLYGPVSTPYAYALMQRAELQRYEGRLREAAASHDEALRVEWNAEKDTLSYFYLTLLVFCANAHRVAGEPVLAESLLERSCLGYETRLRGSGGGLRKFSTALESPYPYLCLTRLALHRGNEAWEAAERGRARAMDDLLSEPRAGRGTEDSLAQAEDNLTSLITMLEAERTEKASGGKAGANEEGATAALLASARDSLLGIETALAQVQAERSRRAGKRAHEDVPLLGRVRGALRPDQALIGWVDAMVREGVYESWGYAVRNRGPVYWTCLDSARADPATASPARLQAFLDAISRPPGPLSPDPGPLAQAIWRSRFRPLIPALEGVKSLVVVPSSLMLGVPIEALCDESGTPVGSSFEVAYVPSAMTFVRLRHRASSIGAAALLVGDPSPGDAQARPAGRDRGEDPTVAPGVLRGVLRGERNSIARLPAIPASRDEVESIATCFPSRTVLLRRQATEDSVEEMAASGRLGRYGVIHLSTHAIIDDEDPERSALVLSQADLPDPVREAEAGRPVFDGLLRAGEILHRWRLHADLVTLSACQTAVGPKIGEEGYIGFSQALLTAGARSLVLSLWKVDDRATELLMKRFYENRARARSNAEALREAREWLRATTGPDGRRPYRSPYYWAAFVAVGDAETPRGKAGRR